MKHGDGGVTQLGCLTAVGFGRLRRRCREILENFMQPARNLSLQHDNDPKHTAKNTQDCLKPKNQPGNQEFVAGPENGCSLTIPLRPDQAYRNQENGNGENLLSPNVQS